MGMVFMRAIILAGGESSRMGQDKALIMVQERSLLQRQLDDLLAEDMPVVVVANENKLSSLPKFYQNHPLIKSCEDMSLSKEGPLSGLLAGLRFWSGYQGDIMLLSCDSFGLSTALFQRLKRKKSEQASDIACLSIEGKTQPLVAVLGLNLLDSLQSYFQEGGRSVMKWYQQHSAITIDELELRALNLLEGQYATNLNTLDDVACLERKLLLEKEV